MSGQSDQAQTGTQQNPPAGTQPAAAKDKSQPEESCADRLRTDYHSYNPFARFMLWTALAATTLYMGYAGCRNTAHSDPNAKSQLEQKVEHHNAPVSQGSEIR